MKKSELKEIIKEEILKEYNPILKKLANASEDEKASLRRELTKATGWRDNDIDYMLRKYKKDLSLSPIEPQPQVLKKPILPKWNDRKYNKWVKEMGYNEDGEAPLDYGLDMAQNAKYEPGLLDYIERKIRREGGDENPLERIAWDIEANL